MTIHSLRNATAWGLIAAVLAPLTSIRRGRDERQHEALRIGPVCTG